MLKKFFVKKLFGIFDNEIEFRKEGVSDFMSCHQIAHIS